MPADAAPTDVLVIGAGPTGLAAACDALRYGLTVRVVERRATRSPDSKALVLHARTLEILEVMGCAREILKAGRRFRALNVRTSQAASVVRVDLLARRWGDTRYPFWLSIPQYETERVLEERLVSLGGSISWRTTLTALADRGDHVLATLTAPSGESDQLQARWVLGCDGGRSTTRDQLGIALDRQEVGVTFALADVHATSDLVADEGHYLMSNDGMLLIVPLPESGVWRLIAQVPAGTDVSGAEAWSTLVLKRAGIQLGIQRFGWTSRFNLTSGVAERFRKGNVFLLGDAAHVHSPVGGQGLNTGVQDAHNLVWKLALQRRPELDGTAGAALLDTYESERRPIARGMVRSTSLATRLLTVPQPLARWTLGALAQVALTSSRLQDRLGRGVGMLDLRTAGLSRLPNPELPEGGRLHDRIDPLQPTRLRWQGREVLVRPDRIVARPGVLPPAIFVTAPGA